MLALLIEKGIFDQVHSWRCSYCGQINSRSVDTIRRQNECEICEREYYTPLDIKWGFKIKEFVFNSLVKRNGLTVLWALGYLHETNGSFDSFYYLPEIWLSPDYNDPATRVETDILCVREGKFCVVEASKYAIGFLQDKKEPQKFINKINNIRPDIAILVFEEYHENSEDEQEVKDRLITVLDEIKSKSKIRNLQVVCIIACDVPSFKNYPTFMSYSGQRTIDVLESDRNE